MCRNPPNAQVRVSCSLWFSAIAPTFLAGARALGSDRSMNVIDSVLVNSSRLKGSLKCPTRTVFNSRRSRIWK